MTSTSMHYLVPFKIYKRKCLIIYCTILNYHTKINLTSQRFSFLGCTCKDYINIDSVTGEQTGNCVNPPSNVCSRCPPVCFVNLPTTCRDAAPLQNHPGLMSSNSACESGKQ